MLGTPPLRGTDRAPIQSARQGCLAPFACLENLEWGTIPVALSIFYALCGLESLEDLSVRACPYVTFSEPQFRWKTLLGLKRLRLDPPGGDARFTVSMADLYNLNRFSRLTVLDLGCNVAVSKTGANAGVEKLDLRVYPLRCVRELGLYLPPAQIIWPSDVGEWHPKLRALRLLEVGDVLLLGRLRGHPSLHAFAVEDALSMTAQDVAALPRIGTCLRDVLLKKMHPKAAALADRALQFAPLTSRAVEINGMSMRAWNRLEMERYCEKLRRRKGGRRWRRMILVRLASS